MLNCVYMLVQKNTKKIHNIYSIINECMCTKISSNRAQMKPGLIQYANNVYYPMAEFLVERTMIFVTIAADIKHVCCERTHKPYGISLC